MAVLPGGRQGRKLPRVMSAAPNSSPEGTIEATLSRHGDVVIRSTRPQVADRLLRGRTPADAARIVGLLFSLCGRAQGIACAAACEAAAGMPPGEAAERERTVMAEMAREHAWRLLVDWSATPDPAALAHVTRALSGPAASEVLDTVLREKVLGEPVARWQRRDAAGLAAWVAAAATPVAAAFAGLPRVAEAEPCGFLPPLPELSDADLASLANLALNDVEFTARPHWQGAAAETGPLARRQHQPLMAAWLAASGRGAAARMLARLLEFAAMPARLATAGDVWVRALPVAADTGIAAVETSRGLLLHVARLEAGRIAAYRIVAPTEWNFHPHGPIRHALLAAKDAAGAHLAAQSLDACVDFRLTVLDKD